MKMKYATITLAAALSWQGIADQCAWNTYTVGAAARELAKKLADTNNQIPSVYTYCEPCNQKEMDRVYLLTSKPDAQGNQNQYEMTVNRIQGTLDQVAQGKKHSSRAGLWALNLWQNLDHTANVQVDLAYTYVKIAKDRYANLAYAVGCPAEGVSPIIFTDGDTQKSEGKDPEGKDVNDDGILIRDRNNLPKGEG